MFCYNISRTVEYILTSKLMTLLLFLYFLSFKEIHFKASITLTANSRTSL